MLKQQHDKKTPHWDGGVLQSRPANSRFATSAKHEKPNKRHMNEPRIIHSSAERSRGTTAPISRSSSNSETNGDSMGNGQPEPTNMSSRRAVRSSRSWQQPDEGLAQLPSTRSSLTSQTALPSAQADVEQVSTSNETPVLEGMLSEDLEFQRQREMLYNAVDAVDVRADVPTESSRRRWITITVSLGVLLLVGGGTTLGVAFERRRNDNEDEFEFASTAPTTMKSESPSMIPSEAPTSLTFAQVAMLVESAFGTLLDDTSSPQYRAADWMAHVDTLLDLPTISEERFMQRYALVVLYFATGGETWSNQANFLSSDEHECFWNDVAAEGVDSAFGRVGVVHCCCSQQVHTLDLADNNMTGYLPSELGVLSHVASINLFGNRIGGPLSPLLSKMSTLINLFFGTSEITGTIPTEIGNLSSLKVLVIIGSSLTGTIPSEIGRLTALQGLVLGFSNLSGSLPDSVLNLSLLQLFGFFGNRLTGSIPLSLPSKLPKLTSLGLTDNLITGSLPSNIGSLSLLHLEVSNNSLTGTIPESLSKMNVLSIIGLSGNNLIGSLPSDWSRLTNLEILSLESNELTGTLPPSLWGLPRVKSMDLSANSFRGPITPSFFVSKQLLSLLLHDNELTGTIPAFFSQYTSLKILTLSWNNFTGDMSFFCNSNDIILPTIQQIHADCLGEVTCPCCTVCCDTNGACVEQ